LLMKKKKNAEFYLFALRSDFIRLFIKFFIA
jgi:hypothetical protein